MDIFLVKAGITTVVFFFVLNMAGLLTWVERKQSAIIQDRLGANRAPGPFGLRLMGLFHPLADVIKLLTKEDFIPPTGNKFLHTLAPFVSVFFALLAFSAMPIGDTITLSGKTYPLVMASTHVGLLFILAVTSMEVYGVIMAGFASNNNYALLGGLRASAQMFAYEISMGISLVGLVMVYGSLDVQGIVRAQGDYLWGWLPRWGVVVQPLGCLLFLTAAMAQTKRIPFDLPEAESEIIGYFVEYSGMKYGMFFLTDLILTVMTACLLTTLFFGGWHVPFLHPGMVSPAMTTMLQMGAYIGKVVFFIWFQMQVRWTLPRFRYDQLLDLGWKRMFPLAVANIVITGAVLLWWPS